MRKFITDINAVILNEFRVFKRRYAAIIISLIILPLFFTASLGGSSGEAGMQFSPTAQIPIAFIDNDQSVASNKIYEMLVRSGDFNNLKQGYREENAIAALGTGKIFAAIIIPKDFQEKVLQNQISNIVLYVDDGEAGLSDSIFAAVDANLQRFTLDQSQQSQSSELSQIDIIRKGAIFSGFAVGLTIMLAFVVIFATFYEIAGGMSREKENGTYARLMVSPISLGSIMIGKTVYDLVLNIVRTLFVLGLGFYVYGARVNTDVGTIIIISLLISILTMGFGFLISALGVKVRTIIIIEFFLILFLFAFSGFIIDRELLRGFSQTISYLLPWAYGIDLYKRAILIGQPLLSLTEQLLFVGISTIVFYFLSYLILRISRERLIQ